MWVIAPEKNAQKFRNCVVTLSKLGFTRFLSVGEYSTIGVVCNRRVCGYGHVWQMSHRRILSLCHAHTVHVDFSLLNGKYWNRFDWYASVQKTQYRSFGVQKYDIPIAFAVSCVQRPDHRRPDVHHKLFVQNDFFACIRFGWCVSIEIVSIHSIELSMTICDCKSFSEVNDFIFAGNKIDQLDAEAFVLNANGRIIIEQNTFSRIDHSAFTGTVAYRFCILDAVALIEHFSLLQEFIWENSWNIWKWKFSFCRMWLA